MFDTSWIAVLHETFLRLCYRFPDRTPLLRIFETRYAGAETEGLL